MRKILLLEPDKEQAELFTGWLRQEGYGISLTDNFQDIQGFLADDKFDILLMDMDFPVKTQDFATLQLIQSLKKDVHSSGIPIIALTYKKDIKKIVSAIRAGVDSFVLKPFETDVFLKRIDTIFKQIELKKQGRKVLDLDYINYLIALASDVEREDLFLLTPVIFNTLILEKINTILGPQVIMQIIKRTNEMIGVDYEFMKSVEFLGGRISFDGVEKVSKEAPVKKITTAFRDYVYAFLHLVRMLTSDILMERGA